MSDLKLTLNWARVLRLHYDGQLRNLLRGVANNLFRRVSAHKAGLCKFTARYRLTRLVYFESTNDIWCALEREKQIKRWRREKKIRLIKKMNPRFLDLSEAWQISATKVLAESRASS